MSRRRAYTLIEMLTTVAALVILLGLMVSLARDVRRRSATELTNEIIGRLDNLMEQYVSRSAGHALPVVASAVSSAVATEADGKIDEDSIRAGAWKNNQEL